MMERSISAEEIRFYLLYWDHVVIPTNNLIHIGIPDEGELQATGAIKRPRVQYAGSFAGDQVTNAVLACQAIVAGELSGVQDVDWVLHQFGGDVLMVPGTAQEAASLRIALASVLPVPPATTPIAEVLEFKHKKAADLAALHDCLDELYLDILRAPDRELGARKVVSDLRSQVQNLGAKHSAPSAWRRFDLSVEFSVRPKDIIVGLAAGAALGAAAGLGTVLTSAAGVVVSLVEVKLSKSHAFGTGSRSNRLAYLSAARGEGLVT